MSDLLTNESIKGGIMPSVDIYTTDLCQYCRLAKQFLTDKGITFNELRIDEEPSLRDTMNARQPGLRSVPQIFIGDTHVGGYDDLLKLAQTDELNTLLNK